jgi:hypothetical protein
MCNQQWIIQRTPATLGKQYTERGQRKRKNTKEIKRRATQAPPPCKHIN